MPMGTTSYFLRSMDLRMEAAERRETSCSPERPPKRMPMRVFFFMSGYKFLLISGFLFAKKFAWWKREFYWGFLRFGEDSGWFFVVSYGGMCGKRGAAAVTFCVLKMGHLSELI